MVKVLFKRLNPKAQIPKYKTDGSSGLDLMALIEDSIKIILFNHGKEDFIVNNNDRIAQMVLMPILKIEFEEVDELPETIRGSGGFGSTGKWIKN